MSTEKYIEEVLEMPSNMPLFQYNVNFNNLRRLIEDVNVQTNHIQQQLKQAQTQMKEKLPHRQFYALEQILNRSLRFGLDCQKFADNTEDLHAKNTRKQLNDMTNMEQYTYKMERMTAIMEHIFRQCDDNKKKIQNDNHKNQLAIDQAFRRIDQKVQASLDSMTKNINLYFTDTNGKLSSLQTDLNEHKRNTTASFETVNQNINTKVSMSQLQASLKGINERVKSEMEAELKDDNMKRLAVINQFSTKLNQHIKDVDIKAKATRNNVKQLSEKVQKALQIKTFEIQKHKIYQKLSEYKNKIDDLGRGRQDFVDFRKNSFQINQRIKQNIIGIEDDIKKLREKGSSFQKMEDIGEVLSALDPHLICELGSQVKLHEKELGKLEKQVTYLQSELESARNENRQMPEINNGQTSDAIIKIIKQYMSNLDFQGRVKRAQKQINDLSKRSDGVNELQKKVFMLAKDMDMGMIMRQIKRKADEQSTRKDNKILDAKLDKLFQFYKQVRKELQMYLKNSRNGTIKNDNDNPSLTTKKLHSPNCLSCTPKHRPHSSRRINSKPKYEHSLQESMEQMKHSMYVRGTY